MTSDSKIENKLSLEGHLTIFAVYDDGRREVLSDKKNQIVNGFLTTGAELISQKTGVIPAELAIHSLWLEASDTALTQTEVLATDTGPEGTVTKYYDFTESDIDTNVGAEPGLVEFRGVLDKSESNGDTIRAAGLYTRGTDDPHDVNDVRLVARQIFGSIKKESDFALEFTWRVQFKIA